MAKQRDLTPAEITYVKRTVDESEGNQATVSFYGNMAWVEDPNAAAGVQIFPMDNRQFIVHQETAAEITLHESILDAVRHAIELIETV